MTDKPTRKPGSHAPSPGAKQGDFPLGSIKSRAAARAWIQELNRPIPPPWGTLILTSLTFEEARELYEKFSALHGEHIIGTPWFPVRWPDGFKPSDPIRTAHDL